MLSKLKRKTNRHPPVQRSNTSNSEIHSTTKHSTPEQVRGLPALIAVIGWHKFGKTTFVNSASGSRLSVGNSTWGPKIHGVQASNEFELDGQRIVLIDTPGFTYNALTGANYEKVTGDIKKCLAKLYPTGTKLAGVVFVQQFTINNTYTGHSLSGNIEALKELCGDTTLKNVVIMTYRRDKATPEAEQRLNLDLSPGGCFHPAIEQGAQVYHCTDASNPDLGALRVILRGRSVTPKVQQEPTNESSGPERIAPTTEPSKEIPKLAERHDSDDKKLEESIQEVLNKKVEELRRELEEQKSGAQQEVDLLKKHIAEMQSKEESTRKEICPAIHSESSPLSSPTPSHNDERSWVDLKTSFETLRTDHDKLRADYITLMKQVEQDQKEMMETKEMQKRRDTSLERMTTELESAHVEIEKWKTQHTALGQCVIDQQMEILRTKQKALSDLEEARFEIANLQVRATQELEEQKRKAQEEADGLGQCIAEMQSKLEERHRFAFLPLDRSSPQFADQLNEALHGLEWERFVQSLDGC